MLVYVGLHNLGKEDLLVSLAHSLQTWIGVPRDRYVLITVKTDSCCKVVAPISCPHS